jgi:antitoxin (DNA-binding transcriptional repressor) of toxin-antitoxin stability system
VAQEVATTGRPALVTRHGRLMAALVTRHGRLMAALVPVAESDLEDFVLANAPELVAATREAEEDLQVGQTRALDDVLAELDEEQPGA